MSNKPKARRKARRPGQKGDGSKVATNPIACELCDVQLKNSCAYNTHFRQMHPGKNRTLYPTIKTPYMCELCGKIFKYRALMNYHRGTHTGERPFVCNVCGKAFQTRQYLQLHEYAHTAKHDCPVCGKQFSRPCNRERHMLVHTDVRPFECNVCGKAFKSLREKRDHIAYVHMKKPLPKRNRKKRRADGRTGQTKVSADESERDEKSPVDDIDSIMED
ncbi:zinc finger and BTB domain-containing protein 41-like [Aphomia sociella]